jgi:glycosyltransferase involved in cell wall biosynthesis
MRILEVITPSRIGGAEVNLVTIVRGLTALGEQVTVFCPAGRPLVELLKRNGIAPVTWKTWGKLDPRTLAGFVRLIRSRRIDVVHTHLSTASLLGSLAARRARTPCVASVHGFSGARWYRLADKVTAISQAVKKHLVAQGLAEEKIEVIHAGILVEQYVPMPVDAAKRACGFDPSVPRAGVFGRLSPEKGQDVAIAAWSQVLRQSPNAVLMLVGQGRTRPALGALAKRLGIAHSVEFAGFVPDPKALMCACDAVIVPSRREGLGLAAIEAMALERPVIASDAGGLLEVVTTGETGLVFPAGEAGRIADGVVRMLEERDLAARLGEAGRQRVQGEFSADRQVARLREVLASVARGGVT